MIRIVLLLCMLFATSVQAKDFNPENVEKDVVLDYFQEFVLEDLCVSNKDVMQRCFSITPDQCYEDMLEISVPCREQVSGGFPEIIRSREQVGQLGIRYGNCIKSGLIEKYKHRIPADQPGCQPQQ